MLAITYLDKTCSLHLSGGARLLTVRWISISSLSNGQSNASEKEIGLINILRDSNRGGLYYPLIATEEILDYILLDFRTSKPNKNRGMFAFSPSSTNVNRLDDIPFLYFIVFSKDYTSYEIYDAKLNLVVERVALVNHKN